MVSLEAPNLLQLAAALTEAVAADEGQPPHACGMAAWMLSEEPAQAAKLHALAREVLEATGAQQTTDTALLGYAAHFDAAYRRPFTDRLDWLSQRQPFAPGRVPGFEIDGLALLGVAVGLSATLPAQPAPAWFTGLLHQSLAHPSADGWNGALIAGAAAVSDLAVPAGRLAGDLHLALASKGVMKAESSTGADAWALISTLSAGREDVTRAAVQANALRDLLRRSSHLRTEATSAADVANLLHGVERSLHRWAWEDEPRTSKSGLAKWTVDNEYHVQDLLWAILAPAFNDLTDEEWLPSLGPHQPRADLAIPSLGVIVEVKFARPKKAFSKLVDEVAADASTYLREGNGYHTLLAFIWDDARRTEEHALLRRGLMALPGVKDAIVVSRPAKMVREPHAAQDAE